MRRWITLAAIVVALNFAWEMAQGGLFRGMPVIAGVGLAPLLQWLIVPTLEVIAARALPPA